MTSVRHLVWVFVLLTGASCAAQVAGPAPASAAGLEDRGYRVRGVRWDPVLGREWRVLESIEHPGRPLLAELSERSLTTVAGATGSEAANVAASPAAGPALSLGTIARVEPILVRYGDRVTVWTVERNVQMELAGVAEGNGRVGEEVKLRVRGAGVNGDQGWLVRGIVRGAGNVEMEP